MYTQCTNCKTLFRITEEQLAMVGGKVRCGFCYSTFNAYEALYEELPAAEDEPTAEQAEQDETEYAQELEGADQAPDYETEEDAFEPQTAFEPQPSPAQFPVPADTSPGVIWGQPQLPEPPPPAAQQTLLAPTPPRQALPGPATGLPAAPPRPVAPTRRAEAPPATAARPAIEHGGSVRTAPQAQARRPAPPPAPLPPQRSPQGLFPFPQPAPVPAGGPPLVATAAPAPEPGLRDLPNLFDAIDVAGKELQQVSRVQLDRRPRAGAAAPAESRATLAYTLATFLMVALIAGQYGYFMRNDLARFPQLRPWLEKLCDVTGCTIPLMYTPQLIKLVSRDIRTHPTEKDALQVRARILNEAAYPQAYPVLRVELSDVNGKVIASRLFQPNEYLPQGVDIEAGIDSKAQADVELDLLDPSRAAVGFEFGFL